MSIYDPAEEQREIALLKAKLSEKGRAFNEALLMQGAEIAALRAEVERLKVEYAAAIERGMLATADLQGKVAEAEDLLLLAADAVEAEVERLRAALSWTVGGSGQRLPTPETVAAARALDRPWLGLDPLKGAIAALRGEGEKP